MRACPAPPANAEERPSAEQQSALGTQPALSSGLDGLTLTDCLIALIQRLDVVIAQNQELIEMMLDDGGQEEDGPSRAGYDLAGRLIQ